MSIRIENNNEYTTSVRFASNISRLIVRCDVSAGDYRFTPHTGPCVQQGICFMYRQGGGTWRPLESGLPRKTFNINMLAFTDEGSEYEILVYFSLACRVNFIEIEEQEGHYLRLIGPKEDHIFVIGGKLSQGIGCATPGVVWSALLGRKTGREVYSLRGGDAFPEQELAGKTEKYKDVISSADYIIIESDAVAGAGELETITGMLAGFGKPVIVLADTPRDKDTRDEIKRAAIKGGAAAFLDMSYLYDDDGDFRSAYRAGEDFHESDFYTLGSGIPTDAAHYRIYEELRKLTESKTWNI